MHHTSTPPGIPYNSQHDNPDAQVKNVDTFLFPSCPKLFWSPTSPGLCLTHRFTGFPLKFWFRKPGVWLRICVSKSQVIFMIGQVWETVFFPLPPQLDQNNVKILHIQKYEQLSNPFPFSPLWKKPRWGPCPMCPHHHASLPTCISCHLALPATSSSCLFSPASSFTFLPWLTSTYLR